MGVLDISRQLGQARRRLRAFADRERARLALRFFKTAPGEYGEGDRFLGMHVPDVRKVAREFRWLSLSDLRRLFASPWHEERLLALVILADQYRRGGEAERDSIYRLYLASTDGINNWDLVDVSAPAIVGAHLQSRSRAPLLRLAKSRSLWKRRIAIMATHHYIRRGEFDDTLAIAAILVHDEHGLIHKAVGWMLREIGIRDREAEERFLRQHAATMPRTMLRYAIERFPARLRRRYLAKARPSPGASRHPLPASAGRGELGV